MEAGRLLDHLRYSRLSGLQPGQGGVVVTSSFSDSIVFKQGRFQIVPLWRAFSERSVFADRFRRCSVDGSRIRNKTVSFSADVICLHFLISITFKLV